jgi:hypothetical protein
MLRVFLFDNSFDFLWGLAIGQQSLADALVHDPGLSACNQLNNLWRGKL